MIVPAETIAVSWAVFAEDSKVLVCAGASFDERTEADALALALLKSEDIKRVWIMKRKTVSKLDVEYGPGTVRAIVDFSEFSHA